MSRSIRVVCSGGACLGLVFAALAQAQMPTPIPATAPAQPDALPLYPQERDTSASEQWMRVGQDYLVRNVTRPTLTPVLPAAGHATGAAVVVAPGGAFMMLSMQHEGWSVAHALAAEGIAAFVLKYRLNATPADHGAFLQYANDRMGHVAHLGPNDPMPDVSEPRATEDALAAIHLVRAKAKEWGVDASRVGLMGFSAGAMTALNAGLAANTSDRPAFIAPIYPPMLARQVPADAPALFVAIALDDELFGRQGFALIDSWHRANRPVELHAYEHGGHGFGLGRPGTTSTLVLQEFVAWLRSNGELGAAHHEAGGG